MNNTGDRNSGDRNSGYRNSGNRNTGDWNSGDRNSGYWNSGDRNSGYRNSGNRNTGDWNTGDWNSGDWNSGDWNSGYFNIDEPKVRIFGKETDIKREDIPFPNFCYFNLTEWINESDMTNEEKEVDENEYHKTTGGYLKSYEYQEAFKNSYNKLSEEERKEQTEQLKALPNWNPEIFKQISGIDINIKNEEIKEYTIEQLQEKLGETFKIIKGS